MSDKISLLKKYSIPIESLDYEYIRECKNAKELTQILEILLSGEEGFYPDLNKFTETKLMELDPCNRLLTTEIPCKPIDAHQRKEINDFAEKIKLKDRQIRVQTNDDETLNDCTFPIRALSSSTDQQRTNAVPMQHNNHRINSWDYGKWDKYDADTECLKMDIQEEQNQEADAIKEIREMKIIEINSETTSFDKYSATERQELADKYRLKGNEHFKCSHFEQALSEYTKSLKCFATFAVFNNRALTYIKQKKWQEAINDCDECLRLDPTNVKAMLRKCDALIAINKKNDAYKIYKNVLQIDPNSAIAKASLKNISIRLKITDVCDDTAKRTNPKLEHSTDEKIEDCNDFQTLIVPKKIVKSKLTKAMENIKRINMQ